MTSIELRHVTTDGAGGRPLLDDINLTVPTGTTLAITAVTSPPSAVKSMGKADAGLTNSSTGEAAFACAGMTVRARAAISTATPTNTFPWN